jgi:hypothetical protein
MFGPPALLGALVITSAATASDSVVLGHGVSNAFLSQEPCAQPSPCVDASYVWVLDATRTVVGPNVAGRVRAIATQHTAATPQFVKSVELFVLRPIGDQSLKRTSRAKFYLVALSARNPDNRYCLTVKPSDVGLHLEPSMVTRDTTTGYCFSATALASNNRWRGP